MNRQKKMIDTIILTIPREQIRMLSPDGRYIPAWDLHSKTNNYTKYVKNPTPYDRKNEIYRPRLTGVKRRVRGNLYNSFLKIEFSVPKLIFGNNLNELSESDFPKVLNTLKERLIEVGVLISDKDLRQATVSTVHFGKNIELRDGYTASFVTKELSKININKKFDLSKTSFRNDGQSLQGYTMAHSVVFYDKVSDLGKSKKRAIDKDQVPNQLSLFSGIKASTPSLEILRFEVRLCQKQKLNGVLRKIGFKKDPTFEDIFKADIWKKALLFYWDQMIKNENLFLFSNKTEPKELLQDLLKKYPNSKAKEYIFLVGLDALCKSKGGIRDLRSILETKVSQRSWYRISDGIKRLNKATSKRKISDWVKQIEDSLNEFKPYHIEPKPP